MSHSLSLEPLIMTSLFDLHDVIMKKWRHKFEKNEKSKLTYFLGSFTEPSIKSQRISVAGELLNTEINYVRILKILCHKYKAGLENENQCKFSTFFFK